MKKITILGGGPAGYASALYADHFDLEVTLVEADGIGGTCLNRGCIPAKHWLHVAEVNRELNTAGELGINVKKISNDWNKTSSKRNEVIDQLTGGVTSLLKSKKVNILEGWGTLINKNTISVKKPDGSEESIESDYILLATGSVPKVLPGFEFDGDFIISSDEALEWIEPPKKVCIVGAGAIGCEFASLLVDLDSDTTVVELEKEILPGMDKRTAGELRKQLTKRGAKFKLGVSITSFDKENRSVTFSDNTTEEFDAVLISIGRNPLTDSIGIDDLGVKRINGFVEVDLSSFQTSISNIYAAGDIVHGTPQLAHVGFAEGIAAITHIATGEEADINYDAIPYVVYTSPEVAEVGINAENAKSKDMKISHAQHSFVGVGRAIIQNQNNGVVKVFYQEDGPIVGASICGPDAGEVIHELMYMVGWEVLPKEAADFIHAHPTLSEAVGEALMSASGRGLH